VNQQAMGLLAGMCIGMLVVFALILTVYILYLLNLHRTLAEVDERNREMSPGLVWLMLIPLFSTFWAPYMVAKIANSLRNEFEDRRWPTEGEGFTRSVGMIFAWGGVVNFGLSIIQNVLQYLDMMSVAMVISFVGLPIGLALFVLWIVYWVQTHQYKVRLREGGRGYRPGGVEEDYDDSFRPRRTREEYEENEEGEFRRNRDDGRRPRRPIEDNDDDFRRDDLDRPAEDGK
jgi:hypothetical protein